MYKKSITSISFLIAIMLLICSMKSVYAESSHKGKGGKGEHAGWAEGKKAGQKSETLPVWEKGLKKDWKKAIPPGWDNWDKKARKGWKRGLAKAKKGINVRAKKKDWNTKDREKITIALEYAVRKGVPVSYAEKVIGECIGHGLKGDETLEIGIALSNGVAIAVNYETLSSQVVEKIIAGYRGKKLVNEIHAMIKTKYKDKISANEEVEKPGGSEKPEAGKKEEKTGKSEKVMKESAKNKDIEKSKESEIRIYEVFGMDCPGCHGGLNKLVKKIPGIQQAEANWVKKQLVVTIKQGAKLNDEDINDAIRRANFTPGKRIQ